jgi:hypothetical protein
LGDKFQIPSTKYQTNFKHQNPDYKQLKISKPMKRKNIFKAAIVLALVGVISAGLVYKFVINKPHMNMEKAKPAYIISAADLFNNFRTGQEEAELKYNGKVVLLSGKLDKIEVTDNQVTGVFVFNQGMFGDEGVRCSMLPNHASGLKSIPEGSEIQLKGYLTGYNETDVILEQCSVIL